MNKIILSGRLTEDPKIMYGSGSPPLAHAVFNFAVPDMTGKKDQQGNYPSDFFRCTAWGNTASTVERHCCKGIRLLIAGKLKNNNYEKNGRKIYSNEIVIESLEFLEPKNMIPVRKENGNDQNNA